MAIADHAVEFALCAKEAARVRAGDGEDGDLGPGRDVRSRRSRGVAAGRSRSEFYARAAERWLVELDDEERRPRSTVRWRESTTRRRWSTSRS